MIKKKTGLVIQARMGSQRLRGKSNLEINGQKVLNWVFNTAKVIKGIDIIILATSVASDCDCLVEIAKMQGICCIRGSEKDVLSRYITAIREYDLETVIRITGDDVCQDPNLVELGLKEFHSQKCDYLISTSKDFSLLDGLIFEIFKGKLLLETNNRKDLINEDKEHVTMYIRKKKINYKQGFINKMHIPKIYEDKFNIKLCVDSEEDLLNLRKFWAIKNYNNKLIIADTKTIINNFLNHLKISAE